VAFWAAETPILTLLYGDRFAVAASAARLLVAGGGLAMLTQLGFIVLVSANRSRVYPWLGLAALSLNIGLNLVLIPHMSYNGAAVATIITESVLVVMVWVMIGRTIPVRGLMPLREIVGLALLGAAMIALSTVVLRWVPWPVVTLGCVLVVPLASHGLRLTRDVPLRDFLPRGRKT
jgi:O-antigen/teichoic acid export membrane protein